MTPVCRSDDLADGEAQRFDVEGHRIALVRIGDTIHDYSIQAQLESLRQNLIKA